MHRQASPGWLIDDEYRIAVPDTPALPGELFDEAPRSSMSCPGAQLRRPEESLPSASGAAVRAPNSAATPVASAAPILWKISSACRRPAWASAVRPAARAQRPRPASVGLIPGAADPAGQVQSPPVTRLGLVQITADPVQRSQFVGRLSRATPADDAQRRLQYSAAPGV